MSEYPHHLKTFSYIGFHRYFLTFCCHERAQHFVRADVVTMTLREILRATAKHKFAVIAYCFMPDHLHWLVAGETESADLKAMVSLAKQFSGYVFKQTQRTRLWQRYGFERALRHDEATPAVVRYIVNNPVRAGLTKHPLDYPFWGSSLYTREALLDYIGTSAETWSR